MSSNALEKEMYLLTRYQRQREMHARRYELYMKEHGERPSQPDPGSIGKGNSEGGEEGENGNVDLDARISEQITMRRAHDMGTRLSEMGEEPALTSMDTVPSGNAMAKDDGLTWSSTSNIARYLNIKQHFLQEMEESEEEEEEVQPFYSFGGGGGGGEESEGEESDDEEKGEEEMGEMREEEDGEPGSGFVHKDLVMPSVDRDEYEMMQEDNVEIDLVKFSSLRNPAIALDDNGKHDEINVIQTVSNLKDEKANSTLQVRPQFFSQFKSLLNNPYSHDVVFVFVASGQRIYAHKLILNLRSEYFRVMFSSGMHEAMNNEVFIEDVEYDIFLRMLEFIYTAELRVTSTNVIALMACASQFQVTGIHSLLRDYIQKFVDVNTVCHLLEEANRYNAHDIVTALLKYIDHNTGKVLKSHNICVLSPEAFIQIIGRRTIQIDEMEIFETCRRWCHEHVKYLKQQKLDEMRAMQEGNVDDVDDDDEVMEERVNETELNADAQSLFEMVAPYIQWISFDPIELRDHIEFKYPGLVPKKYLLQAYRFQVTCEVPKGMLLTNRFFSQLWHFDPNALGTSLSLSNNNLTVEKNVSTSSSTAVGNVVFQKKRSYFFAVKIEKIPSTSYVMVGASDPATINLNSFLSHNPRGYAFYSYQPMKYHNSISATYGEPFVEGDEIGVLVDLKRGKIEFFKNGHSLGVAFTGVNGPLSPCVTLYSPHDRVSIVRRPKMLQLKRPLRENVPQ